MKKRNVVLGLTAAAVLALGAIVGVAAQSTGSDTGNGNFITKLAANLGIGEDKLKSAIQQTENQTIDEQLAAGKITQEQADKLKQRAANGGGVHFGFGEKGRGPGAPGDKGGRELGLGGVDLGGVIQSLTGLTPEQLKAELQSGKTPQQIAQDHGINIDTLKAKLIENATQRLNQAVTDGKITAAQKDQMLARLSAEIDRITNAVKNHKRPAPTATPS